MSKYRTDQQIAQELFAARFEAIEVSGVWLFRDKQLGTFLEGMGGKRLEYRNEKQILGAMTRFPYI